ncbi:MAG: phosphoribosylformylglycinamidine cyclo-ligase [Chloroflexota bacterium]|nr:phosphoribosylformylglycinamidine cyclo-ligase [Chloroflexota bacterium]MDE2884358.1 phosphoribosylformylglycinamidine cyclo-ligase [Chloroflexota bacterium]
MADDARPEQRTYTSSGVDTDEAARGLSGLLSWVAQTSSFADGIGPSLVPGGFFAAVLPLNDRLSLAISTDGVGSKSVLAQLTGDFESIGWDCVAVNVNDIICTGARPIALVDYIALQRPHGDMLAALGKGMRDAAERAGVAIVGGELSQHPDTLTGPREGYAFDISATCVGVLEGAAAPITGAAVRPGDAVIGIASNGIHANGLTLARSVLLGGDAHESVGLVLPECGRTAGEELLRRTHVYVPEVKAMLHAGVDVRGLAHISGDGLLNLLRLDADVEYHLDAMPAPQPVFEVIRREGNVSLAEMYRVYNMGVGFCVVVSASAADAALDAIASAGGEASVIGTVREGRRRVVLPQQGLVGEGGSFAPV